MVSAVCWGGTSAYCAAVKSLVSAPLQVRSASLACSAFATSEG